MKITQIDYAEEDSVQVASYKFRKFRTGLIANLDKDESAKEAHETLKLTVRELQQKAKEEIIAEVKAKREKEKA